VEQAALLVGRDYARKLVEDYPAAIIAGRPVAVPEPAPARKKRFYQRWMGA
jgi:hypothetical protein